MPRDEPTPTVVTHTLGNLALAGEVAGFVCTQPGGTPALDDDLGDRVRRQLAR